MNLQINGEHTALLDRIKSFREDIERGAETNEHRTEVSADVLRGLEEAGVFRLVVPASIGGLEAPPSVVSEVLRTLSYFDGSVGWHCQAAFTAISTAGAFLGDRAVDAIFCSGGRGTCAGQVAPTGKAERVGDGYRISGSFSFGSALPNADWVVGAYILHEDGAPVLRDGNPVMLVAVAPRAKVEILGNWNVLGLRGTGSYDFRVPEQIVHEDFAIDAGIFEQKRGGALYSMGFTALPGLCQASVGLGCGTRILDEWGSYARGKKRPQGGTLAEAEIFQRDFAHAHARLRSAEAYVRTTFEGLYAAAANGSIPDDLALDSRLCASNAIFTGAQISQTVFTSSATTGLRNGSRIQR
jgi:indole-3-acetate monooxygenase